LIVAYVVCLIIEGVANNDKRIRRSRCR